MNKKRQNIIRQNYITSALLAFTFAVLCCIYTVHHIKENGGNHPVDIIIEISFFLFTVTFLILSAYSLFLAKRMSVRRLTATQDVEFTVYVWENVANRSELGAEPWLKLDREDAMIAGKYNTQSEMAACVSKYENPDTVVGVWKNESGKEFWFD